MFLLFWVGIDPKASLNGIIPISYPPILLSEAYSSNGNSVSRNVLALSPFENLQT
jgi:hypothetical protein